MSSIRDQILDAIIAALNTATPGGVPQATRDYINPLEGSDLPAISVRASREESEGKPNRFGPLRQRRLTVRVECFAAGSPGDEELDPLVTWAGKVLSGDAGRFGGLAHCTEETAIEWNSEERDQPFASAFMDFTVEYQTRTGDPTAIS